MDSWNCIPFISRQTQSGLVQLDCQKKQTTVAASPLATVNIRFPRGVLIGDVRVQKAWMLIIQWNCSLGSFVSGAAS